MKRILLLLAFTMAYALSFAQTTNPTPTKFTNGLGSDTYFNLPTQASPPTSPQIRVGSMYHNSISGLYMRYNGTIWESVAMTKQIGDSLLVERNRVNALLGKEAYENARNYLTDSTGTVDQLALLQKAVNRAAINHKGLIMPQWNIMLNGKLTVPPNVQFIGEGSMSHNLDVGTYDYKGTVLKFTHNNDTALLAGNGVSMRDMTVVYAGSGNSAYPGIVYKNAGIFDWNNMFVAGFNDLAIINNGLFWNINHSLFFNPRRYGLRVASPSHIDAGDFAINNSSFFVDASSGSPSALIRYESSGGMKIANSKFLGKYATNHIDAETNGNTGQIQVVNNSFEQMVANGIYVHPVAGAAFQSIMISDNHFAPIATISGNVINIDGSAAGTVVKNINIGNNIFHDTFSNVNPAVKINTATRINYWGNNDSEFSTPFSAINSTNVSQLSPLVGANNGFKVGDKLSISTGSDYISLSGPTATTNAFYITPFANTNGSSTEMYPALYSNVNLRGHHYSGFGGSAGIGRYAIRRWDGTTFNYVLDINASDQVGINTKLIGATHTLTLGSTSTGFAYYNTVNQSTDYERMLMNFSSNVYTFASERLGTGTLRPFSFIGTDTRASGSFNLFSIKPTYNQVTSTASNTDFLINRTETSVGSGTQLLLDAQVGGTTKFNLLTSGVVQTTGNILTNANGVSQVGDATNNFLRGRFQNINSNTNLGLFAASGAILNLGTGAGTVFNVSVANGLYPNVTDTYDVGGSGQRVRRVYTSAMQIGLSGLLKGNNTSDVTVAVAGTDYVAPATLASYELLVNKSTTTTLGTSNTLYPTQNAVKTYVDTQNATMELLANKQNSLAVDVTNTKYPTVTAVNAGDALKQNLVTLTTTGTSGVATFNQSTGALNIPNYATGTGTVTSVTRGLGFASTGTSITTTGTLDLDTTVIRTVANSRTLAQTQTALNIKANLSGGNAFVGSQTFSNNITVTNTITGNAVIAQQGLFSANTSSLLLGTSGSSISTNLISGGSKAFELPNTSGTFALIQDTTATLATKANLTWQYSGSFGLTPRGTNKQIFNTISSSYPALILQQTGSGSTLDVQATATSTGSAAGFSSSNSANTTPVVVISSSAPSATFLRYINGNQSNLQLNFTAPTITTNRTQNFQDADGVLALTKDVNAVKYTHKTANYTVLLADWGNNSMTTVTVDATAGNTIITLPTASTVGGKIINVKRLDGSVNTLTVSGNGVNIDGTATVLIPMQYGNIQIQSISTDGGTTFRYITL